MEEEEQRTSPDSFQNFFQSPTQKNQQKKHQSSKNCLNMMGVLFFIGAFFGVLFYSWIGFGFFFSFFLLSFVWSISTWMILLEEKPGHICAKTGCITVRRCGKMETFPSFLQDIGSLAATTQVNIIEGESVTLDVVRRAVLLLMARFEVLNLGVHQSYGRYYLHSYPDDGAKRRLVVIPLARENDESWKQELEKINNDFFCCADPWSLMFKVYFLQGNDGRHEVIWTHCHTLIDGMSRRFLAEDFLEALSYVVSDKEDQYLEDFPRQKLEEPVDVLKDEKWFQMRWYHIVPVVDTLFGLVMFLKNSVSHTPVEKTAAPAKRRNRFFGLTLTPEESDVLKRWSKSRGVKLNATLGALLSGAMIEGTGLPKDNVLHYTIALTARRFFPAQKRTLGMYAMMTDDHIKVVDTKDPFEMLALAHHKTVHRNDDTPKEIANKALAEMQGLSNVLNMIVPMVIHGGERPLIGHTFLSNTLVWMNESRDKKFRMVGTHTMQKDKSIGWTYAAFMNSLSSGELCMSIQLTDPVVDAQRLGPLFSEYVYKKLDDLRKEL